MAVQGLTLSTALMRTGQLRILGSLRSRRSDGCPPEMPSVVGRQQTFRLTTQGESDPQQEGHAPQRRQPAWMFALRSPCSQRHGRRAHAHIRATGAVGAEPPQGVQSMAPLQLSHVAEVLRTRTWTRGADGAQKGRLDLGRPFWRIIGKRLVSGPVA